MPRLNMLLLAVVLPIWCGSANAACSIERIEQCTSDDPASAKKLLLEEIAKDRTPELLFQLGRYYRTAPPVFRDYTQAIWYFRRATDAGSTAAMKDLAEMLARGEGVRVDTKQAVELLKHAVAAGDTSAQKALDALLKATHTTSTNGSTTASASSSRNGANQMASGRLKDPPAVLAGHQITIERAVELAYRAGFRTRKQLLSAVAVAVAESGLWTAARNWQPAKGFRPKSDQILVSGPPEAWSADGRQMHSDRGLWQIASWSWARYPDSMTDNPARAAMIAFVVSKHGTDFSSWNSYRSGRAQKHFDKPFDGWPALRPLIGRFLETMSMSARD